MTMRHDGRVAVVTGGGAGIGEAICHRLADEGARVAVLDISLSAAQQTIKAIGDGLAAEVDVSDSAAVDAAFAGVERDLGPVDVLVNNAGAVGLDHVRRVTPRLERQRAEMAAGKVETPLDALVRLSDEEWRYLMAVHLDGTFYCTRAAVRSMAARGTGVIVNMASICGIEGCTGHPHYAAAKAGILGFTRAVAREVGSRNIRVNAICPGFIDTPMTQPVSPLMRKALTARTPLGRWAEPEEVAKTALFLASDDSSFFTGQWLSPNGGLFIG